MKKLHIARLIESELEQYEVILASRSILDKLQKIAEDLSKIEGNEILPLIDNMNSLFGPEKTNAFSSEVTTALRELVTNTTSARERVGSAIDVLEGKAPATDMAAGDDSAPMAGNDMEAPELNTDETPAGEPAAPEAEGSDSIDDILGGGEGGKQENPLGRVRKESIQHIVTQNAKTLQESKNPDKLILTIFNKLVEAKNSKAVAITRVAEAFGIDADDVRSIVKEHSTQTIVVPKKKVLESEDKPRLRKVANFKSGDKSANVYKDLDWDEFRVKFYTNGVHNEKADYHTSEKDDAINDAKYFCGLNESVMLTEDLAIKVRFVGNETGLMFEYYDDSQWKTLETYEIPQKNWKKFCQEWVSKKHDQGINVDVVGYYFDQAPPISEDFGDMFRGIGNFFKSPVKMQAFKLHPKAVRSKADAIEKGKEDFDSHKGRTIEAPYLLINDNGRIRTYNSDINAPFVVKINPENVLADKWENASTYTPRWKVNVIKKNPKLPPEIKTAWMDAPAYYVVPARK